MNPTQLRTLFTYWAKQTPGTSESGEFWLLTQDLIEAGGFPPPDPMDLIEARNAMSDALNFQDDPDVPQGTVDAAFAEFEKLTAEWTVTP